MISPAFMFNLISPAHAGANSEAPGACSPNNTQSLNPTRDCRLCFEQNASPNISDATIATLCGGPLPSPCDMPGASRTDILLCSQCILAGGNATSCGGSLPCGSALNDESSVRSCRQCLSLFNANTCGNMVPRICQFPLLTNPEVEACGACLITNRGNTAAQRACGGNGNGAFPCLNPTTDLDRATCNACHNNAGSDVSNVNNFCGGTN